MTKKKITEDILAEAFANNSVEFEYGWFLARKYNLLKNQKKTALLPGLKKTNGTRHIRKEGRRLLVVRW